MPHDIRLHNRALGFERHLTHSTENVRVSTLLYKLHIEVLFFLLNYVTRRTLCVPGDKRNAVAPRALNRKVVRGTATYTFLKVHSVKLL